MNKPWIWITTTDQFRALGLALLATLAFIGCGGSKASNVTQYYGNYHPAGWIGAHGGPAVAGISACTKCHEISILQVGSGIPTCMTTGCHHQATPGFADPAIHGLRAKMAANAATGGSLVSCQICHAKDFSGGPSANACASCHGVSAPHPAKPWRLSGGSAFAHDTVDPSNAAVCAQCHFPGSAHNPVGHPATPAPAGTQPGCYNATLCHGAANAAPHPVPFLQGQTDSQGNGHLNLTAAQFASDCSACHAHSGTSPASAAPLCSTCHQLASPVSAGTQAGTCLSCHSGSAGLPNGPGGSSYPSIAGAHVKHMALATALTCDSCHAGSGTGTVTHYTNANARVGTPAAPASVSIDLSFKAKTGGNPGFNGAGLTCSNVSCHGGNTTPSWQNGLINSAVQCTACHGVAASAGVTTQFNDAFGRHSQGTHNALTPANGITCTTCHDMGNGSPGALAHFKYLNTSAVDGVATGMPADQLPSGTIVFDPAIVTGARTYTTTSGTQGNGGCALTCHTHIHAAAVNTWTASGAPHPVPFLTTDVDTQGNGHMNATQATFTADCGTCHAYTGTSPHAESPLCSTCHTLANPVQAGTGAGTCLSCHVGPSGIPAGPTGSAYPNIAGAHAKHMGLLTTLTCNTCHSGAGSGTATHYDNANARVNPPTGPATVKIDATFNAQTGGNASFNATSMTCSASSCHGGQTTPNWRTGTINSTTQCSLCHAINGGTATSQYNDAIGRHAWGTHATAATLDCALCHDMSSANASAGAVRHFAELNTPAVSSTNKLPSGTIKFKLTSGTYPITGAATYTITASTPEGDGGCALTCHNQNHVPADNHWNAPKGSGVAHPVPFLSTDVSSAGYHHQTVTLAQFNLECATCHDQTGTTTTKSGPTCTTCHTLGSPVATGMTAGTCMSCHTGANFTTAGPTGTAWPNLTGSHPKHLGLLTFTRTSPALGTTATNANYPDCVACHVGAVPGDATNTHYSNANKRVTTPKTSGPGFVQIDTAFNAKSGTAGTTVSASAFTCSNISCHGGQTTPGWQSGTLAVNATTYCTACHRITSTANSTQFNDATGRHNSPNDHNQTCNYCHDMNAGTNNKTGVINHFKYLDTTAVRVSPDQLSSDTIKFGGGSQPATGALTYTVNATIGRGGCALSCHGQTHTTTGNTWN
ncbi:MAG: CxxxxCH/CxxCH domain-containing protein [Holophagaceae bacterium]